MDIRRTGVAALLLAAAAAGCGLSGEDRVCTLIGAESEISVRWDPTDFPAAAAARLCVEQRCEERATDAPGGPWAVLRVPLPEGSRGHQVSVRFTLTGAEAGRPVLDDRTSVRPRMSQPNGPHCEPTVWQASFRAEPGDGLVRPASP